MDWIEVIAAYGRNYSNQAEIQADWNANKDFRVPYGPVTNKQDCDEAGIRVIVRYGQGAAQGGGKVYAVK